MKRGRQGILFRIRLGRKWMTLWLLGVFPVGVIRLANISSVSQSERRRFWGGGVHRFFCPWRYWIWPSSPGQARPKPGLFLVETEGGTRVWMRLRSGLHYQLRAGVHRNRMAMRAGEEREDLSAGAAM